LIAPLIFNYGNCTCICTFISFYFKLYSHYAEHSGYWKTTRFLDEVGEKGRNGEEITFYDSNTGKPLFRAPRGRTFEEFVKESTKHGWPSFRDEEVNWRIFYTIYTL